jgi:hypothetical protein
LSTGVLGTVSTGITASVQDIGNGWYRFGVTRTVTSTFNSVVFSVFPTTANNTFSYTGDGTSGIFIFGAQLSDSASLDPYVYQPVAAPASTAYYGPRFDYDPVTLAPKGLLIEEQRTNLVVPSIPPVSGYGFTSNIAFTANSDISPDGTTSATQFTITGASPSAGLNVTASSATTYTISAYAKAGSISVITLAIGNNSTLEGFRGTFNLSAVTASGENRAGGTYTSSTITAVGNGWYRCTVTGITGTSPTRVYYSTTASTGTFFLWGAQLEVGAFATSYIPTVASQVTRAADSASMIGNNFARWYNVNEGTLYAEGVVPFVGSSNFASFMLIDDGTANNAMELSMWDGSASDPLRWVGFVANSAQWNISPKNYSAGSSTKGAAVYKANDFQASFDSLLGTADTSGSIPVVNRMAIGAARGASSTINGTIKRIAYFNRRLADSELIGITS